MWPASSLCVQKHSYKHGPDLSTENIESSWVEVNRLKNKKLFVGCVYRPPNACSDTFIDLLNDSLSKLPVRSQIVLLGDFNNNFLAQKNGASFKLKRQLRKFAIANDLEQLINSPTRICEQTRTAIDLVVVSVETWNTLFTDVANRHAPIK